LHLTIESEPSNPQQCATRCRERQVRRRKLSHEVVEVLATSEVQGHEQRANASARVDHNAAREIEGAPLAKETTTPDPGTTSNSERKR
jgi:hypothetical protein